MKRVLVFGILLFLTTLSAAPLYAESSLVERCDKVPEKLIVIMADEKRALEERQAALKCLTTYGDKALPVLKKQLVSKNPIVREVALVGLARIGTPKAVNALLAAYKKGQFPKKKDIEKIVFHEITNPAATKILVAALRKIPIKNDTLAPAIAYALGHNIGNKEAIVALIAYAERGINHTAKLKDAGIYGARVPQVALVAISAAKDIPTLLTAVKNIKLFWEIRVSAITAIENKIFDDNALDSSVIKSVIAELTLVADQKKPYQNEYIEVQRSARHALDAIDYIQKIRQSKP